VKYGDLSYSRICPYVELHIFHPWGISDINATLNFIRILFLLMVENYRVIKYEEILFAKK
jgi:hypothetical protein